MAEVEVGIASIRRHRRVRWNGVASTHFSSRSTDLRSTSDLGFPMRQTDAQ